MRSIAPAHLVDGIVDELDGMELVEGDLGLGEVFGDAVHAQHGFAMTMKAALMSMQTCLMFEALPVAQVQAPKRSPRSPPSCRRARGRQGQALAGARSARP